MVPESLCNYGIYRVSQSHLKFLLVVVYAFIVRVAGADTCVVGRIVNKRETSKESWLWTGAIPETGMGSLFVGHAPMSKYPTHSQDALWHTDQAEVQNPNFHVVWSIAHA